MTNDELLREFIALPPEGKRVVADLIAFLRQRYGTSSPVASNLSDLGAESFIGMWRDREDMQDSTAWVRNVRENEWGG